MTSDAAVIVGQRVKAARVAKGHSLRALADIGSFDFNALSRIERGQHNVTLNTLLRLSHFLDVPASVLVEGISGLPAPADDRDEA